MVVRRHDQFVSRVNDKSSCAFSRALTNPLICYLPACKWFNQNAMYVN